MLALEQASPPAGLNEFGSLPQSIARASPKATAQEKRLAHCGRAFPFRYFNVADLLPPLGLERAPAPAALHGVRVIEREPAAVDSLVEINGRAVEVKGALLVDHHGDAVELVL